MGPQFGAIRQLATAGGEGASDVLGLRDQLARRPNASHDAEHFLRVDPPRHTQFRSMVATDFTQPAIQEFEPLVREVVREAFDAIDPLEPIDLVEHLAMPIPLYVVAHFLGVPRQYRERFKQWTDVVMRFNDGLRDASPAEIVALDDALSSMYEYFGTRLSVVGADEANGFLRHITAGTVDGEPLSPDTLQTLCRVVLVGGNETTRHLLSGGVHALAEHPDQRALLVDQPTRIPDAVEEMLRWTSPSRHVCRTATARIELHGEVIEPGDYVMALLASANRDERTWPDADRFDVTRPTRPRHLAFAHGPHTCLGQHLPRLEAKVFFEELLTRFPDYEVVEPPVRNDLVVLNGIDRLMVRLQP
jgi:cytochrome P450